MIASIRVIVCLIGSRLDRHKIYETRTGRRGGARAVRDVEVREKCAIKGRVPDFAEIVRVEDAFYHCGKSIIRSRLWHADQQKTTDALPTYAEALIDHGNLTEVYDDLTARLRHNDEKRLYDK